MLLFNLRGKCVTWGTWCSGITSASHAEGPGFKSQCVHMLGSLRPVARRRDHWPRGVTASTLYSESSDRGSNPRGAFPDRKTHGKPHFPPIIFGTAECPPRRFGGCRTVWANTKPHGTSAARNTPDGGPLHHSAVATKPMMCCAVLRHSVCNNNNDACGIGTHVGRPHRLRGPMPRPLGQSVFVFCPRNESVSWSLAGFASRHPPRKIGHRSVGAPPRVRDGRAPGASCHKPCDAKLWTVSETKSQICQHGHRAKC
jgi:hypothetical protein